MNVEGKKRTRKACVKKGRAVYVNMDEEISKVFAIDRIFKIWLMLSILLAQKIFSPIITTTIPPSSFSHASFSLLVPALHQSSLGAMVPGPRKAAALLAPSSRGCRKAFKHRALIVSTCFLTSGATATRPIDLAPRDPDHPITAAG